MKELCFDISTWQGGINYQVIKQSKWKTFKLLITFLLFILPI